MRTELYSVRTSAEEISLLNQNLRKTVKALNDKAAVRVLYKTEIDYNPRKIKNEIIDSLSADNPPELYIFINALDSQDDSSFRYLFYPLIKRLEKEFPQYETDEEGRKLYPHLKVYTLRDLPGSYPAYCFTFKNKKFIVLPASTLVGGNLTDYLCDAVNCAREIFDKAFTECPDGYILSEQKPAKKNFLSTLFAKKSSAKEEPTEEESQEETIPAESDEPAEVTAQVEFIETEKPEKTEENTEETTPENIDEVVIPASDDNTEVLPVVSSDGEDENKTEETKEEEAEEDDKDKVSGFKKFLCNIFPVKGDSARTILSKIVVLIFSLVFLVGAYLLLDFYVIKPFVNNSDMTEIQEIFNETSEDEIPLSTDAEGNYVATPDELPKKNWAGLRKINKEIVGWIKLDKTKINYPVLFHKEDSPESQFYIYRNYKKKYSDFGSIFMDYRCTEGGNSKNVILHGHNMGSDDSMFGSLIQYARAGGWVQGNTKFYKSTPIVEFDTPELDADWIVFAVMKIDVSNENKAIFNYLLGDFASDAQFMNFVYNIKERSYLDVSVPINADDRLLTLSTCSYESDNMRTVVVARMVRDGEDTSKYVKTVKSVTPQKTVTSSFLSEYKEGNIKWYDGKKAPEGNENLEFMEQAEMYTVTFVDAKGKKIASQQVLKGKDATAPTGDAPRKAADKTYYYKFKGWSPSFKNVTKDLTIKPVFTKHLRPTTPPVTAEKDDTPVVRPTQAVVVTNPPTNPPTKPPTQAPTKTPTQAPTQAPVTQAPVPETTLAPDPVEAQTP